MNMVLMFIMVTTAITSTMSLMIIIFKKKSIMDKEKMSPFECGFNPMSFSRVPFSIHFFIISVLFLIFDIEIIIILPMIITIKSSMLMKWLITSTMVITILLMGLYHEWNNGLLNWTK
uniref:NADH dehydrogenase subunit 3 n=1 Tax=Xestocephalus limpidissimus TaxID=3112140 RepID=UPI002E772BC5|nr:NADH dehydrogenase subunit 3 [Xestocephalus limpidissimus]WRK21329.1 NADH dehydrogenase subunit 3 [Xestocephalus limpidissimus]